MTYEEFIGMTHMTSHGPTYPSETGCDWLGMLQILRCTKPIMLPSFSNSPGLTYSCSSGLLAPDIFSALLYISRLRTQAQLLYGGGGRQREGEEMEEEEEGRGRGEGNGNGRKGAKTFQTVVFQV